MTAMMALTPCIHWLLESRLALKFSWAYGVNVYREVVIFLLIISIDSSHLAKLYLDPFIHFSFAFNSSKKEKEKKLSFILLRTALKKRG
jgi:hypothetical protein